jgi:protein arginine kinase
MFEFTGISDVGGWIAAGGPENDVVISSRIRLSRNLARRSYPGTATAQEEGETQSLILDSFGRLPDRGGFSVLYLDDLLPVERRILIERNFISQSYSLEKGRALVLRSDQRFAGIVGEEDHLRLVGFSGGFSLGSLYDEIDGVDRLLEDLLPYAVSAEWGYLNTSITNLGTGMKASTMLHLPALVMSGLIKKAVKATNQLGLSIRGFFGEGQDSLGSIYLLSNEITIGMSETEIIANLERVVGQLLAFERRTREEMMEKRRVELEDRIFRAYGLLRHCRYISGAEAIDHLSSLRLGAHLGLFGSLDSNHLTVLFFLSQKSHIQKLLLNRHEEIDGKLVEYTRAKIIREFLATVQREGADHV